MKTLKVLCIFSLFCVGLTSCNWGGHKKDGRKKEHSHKKHNSPSRKAPSQQRRQPS